MYLLVLILCKLHTFCGGADKALSKSREQAQMGFQRYNSQQVIQPGLEASRLVLRDSLVTNRVKKVSSGRIIHRFFDTSPMSPSSRYLALFRFPDEDQSPKPGDAGEVVLVDLETGKEQVVA